jgi:phosphatidylserine decarboxylase
LHDAFPGRAHVVITKYGYDVVAVVAGIALAGILLSFFLLDVKPLKYGVPALLVLVLLFTLNFFRDPERNVPADERLVLAPADGKVVLVAPVREDEYLKGDGTQVSIFMSPLDVHVNRFPISGTVGYFKYIPGEYLVAFDDKSSLRNERTVIGVENGKIRVLFKQIAGFIARRIVAEVKEGDRVAAGERFGMIRFGSRVDVIVSRGLTVKISPGDRTVAGETVLAEITPPSTAGNSRPV